MTKKTEKLIALLGKRYAGDGFGFLPEFRGGTGWGRESRADAIAMDLWPSRGLELIGFELKTSRADWLRELKQPDKADPIKQFCDRWYLVVDDMSITKYDSEEVPDDWGLMWPDTSRFPLELKVVKEAPKLAPMPIDRLFLASLMRRAATAKNELIVNGHKYVLSMSAPN